MSTRTRINGLPTMTRSETAAWIALARTGRLHPAMNRPDWPETLAALAAQYDAAAAALSTQPATRTGSQPPAAPQGAPSRPSKR